MTFDPDYTTFPSSELESLAKDYDTGANVRNDMAQRYRDTARMLRNAILCYEAVRESKLEEMAALRGECGRLRAILETVTHVA